jgi:hypothetical protein
MAYQFTKVDDIYLLEQMLLDQMLLGQISLEMLDSMLAK